MHHKNIIQPITVAEVISAITVTPDAPHNFLDDLRSRHGVNMGTVVVTVTDKRMKQHPSKRQLERARQYQRRTR